MKLISIEDDINIKNYNFLKKYERLNLNRFCFNRINLFKYLIFFMIIIINDLVLIILFGCERKPKKNTILNNQVNVEKNIQLNKNNINNFDEFFLIPEVKKQIIRNNITYIETIYGGNGKIGNALIMLNNLINICEKIKCKNIICPKGLEKIIKKPIISKDFNITIFPNFYKDKIKIDINLSIRTVFYLN